MAVNRYDGSRAWYAVSTYSGYEDKVADSIRQRVEVARQNGTKRKANRDQERQAPYH